PRTPAKRYRHGLAYDTARSKTVLFGGYTPTGATSLGDTWEWDGSRWTLRSPALSPSPRLGHALAYDIAPGSVVIFSCAAAAGGLADTWEWDGTTWTDVTPALSPSSRTGYGFAYDSARGKSVLFGGIDTASTLLNDTWEWDGSVWTQATPTTLPPARTYCALA